MLPEKKEPQVIILAGGLGTRLKPITETIPKLMVQINGKPFLEYKLKQIEEAGIRDVLLCVGYLGEQIESYFGNGKQFGLSINYSYEKELLGTAGALKNAESMIKSNPFILMNGDTFHSNLNLQEMISLHRRKNNPITMATSHPSNPLEQELVRVQDGIINEFCLRGTKKHAQLMIQYSQWINAGVYVIDKEVLSLIPNALPCSLESNIFSKLVGRINSFTYEGYLKDLTNVQFCEEFEQYITGGKI